MFQTSRNLSLKQVRREGKRTHLLLSVKESQEFNYILYCFACKRFLVVQQAAVTAAVEAGNEISGV